MSPPPHPLHGLQPSLEGDWGFAPTKAARTTLRNQEATNYTRACNQEGLINLPSQLPDPSLEGTGVAAKHPATPGAHRGTPAPQHLLRGQGITPTPLLLDQLQKCFTYGSRVAKINPPNLQNKQTNPIKPKPHPHHQAEASLPARHLPLTAQRPEQLELCWAPATPVPAPRCPFASQGAALPSHHRLTTPSTPRCLNPSSRFPEVSRRNSEPAPQLQLFHTGSFSIFSRHGQGYHCDCSPTLRVRENGERELEEHLVHRQGRERHDGTVGDTRGLAAPQPLAEQKDVLRTSCCSASQKGNSHL